MIRALIFDLDNTLINSELVYAKALRSIGLSPTHPLYLKGRGEVKKRLGRKHVSARNRLLYLKEILEIDKKFSSKEILRMMNLYEKVLYENIKDQWLSLKRGRLFFRLAKKVPMVVLSNENLRTQLIKMSAMDPQSKYFKTIIASESVGVEKPHAQMFDQAVRSLGVPKRNILMIGDSYSDDIEPALKLGMKAVLTNEFKIKTESIQTRRAYLPVISSLDELERILL